MNDLDKQYLVGLQIGKRQYNNTFQAFNSAGSVLSNCAEITFINNGTSTLILNSTLTIAPTQAISFDGKKDETDVTNYNIMFTGAGTNVCVVIKKIYNN